VAQRRQRRPGRPRSGSPATRAAQQQARAVAGPAPTAYVPHLRSALRELLTQRVAGWRLAAVVVILVAGIAGGQAIADAVGITNGWAVAGIQAGVVAVLVVVTAAVVGYGRWRNAKRGWPRARR
jgi:protein-S-isoprenylcysteine O-methyltransferase Ste14